MCLYYSCCTAFVNFVCGYFWIDNHFVGVNTLTQEQTIEFKAKYTTNFNCILTLVFKQLYLNYSTWKKSIFLCSTFTRQRRAGLSVQPQPERQSVYSFWQPNADRTDLIRLTATLLQTVKKKHANAHRQTSTDTFNPMDTSFFYGMPHLSVIFHHFYS